MVGSTGDKVMKLLFIKGKYETLMYKRRVAGGKRIVMMVVKGKRFIGELYWHPTAKRIIFHGPCDYTPETLDFVRPYMNKPVFYAAWKTRNSEQ